MKKDPFIKTEQATADCLTHSWDLFKVSCVAYYELRPGVQLAKKSTDPEMTEKITAILQRIQGHLRLSGVQLELVKRMTPSVGSAG